MENMTEHDIVKDNIRVNALLNSNVCELIEEGRGLQKTVETNLSDTKKVLTGVLEKGLENFKGESSRSGAQLSKEMQEHVKGSQQALAEMYQKGNGELAEVIKKLGSQSEKEAQATRKVLEDRTQNISKELDKAVNTLSYGIQKLETGNLAAAKKNDENAGQIISCIRSCKEELDSSAEILSDRQRKATTEQGAALGKAMKQGFEETSKTLNHIAGVLNDVTASQVEFGKSLKNNSIISLAALISGVLNLILIIFILTKIM